MIHTLAFFCLMACGAPSKPLPAITETVRFTNGDITLEGDLVIPESTDKVPLVVFVHGSGQSTRRESIQISTALNEAGFATFRYDKRGVGRSGGTFMEVGTWNSRERIPLLASDAAAATELLRNHARIDGKKIIMMGGSQAGWIIPVVTSLTEVWRAVIISGPTVSVGEEIYYSELAENKTHTQEDADTMLGDFHDDHGFTNVDFVSTMTKPSLWIFGGKDVSIPAKKCISTLESIKSKNRLPIDIKIYPNANHGIFNETTGHMENYFPVVIDWLKAKQQKP